MKINKRDIITTLVIVGFVFLCASLFGVYGAIGFLLLMLGFIGYKAWGMREMIIPNVQFLEQRIFGKPLNKELWRKGEMKNTKVEVVYKGKKLVTNNGMSKFFFFACVVFFIIFAFNQYTMNIIGAFFCLILAGFQKTWHLIRELEK